MEESLNNSEVNSEVSAAMYSARELAEMRLTGLPDTERAWLDRAKNGNWKFKEVPGRGRGGVKRIYVPSPEIVALIEARKRGERPAEPIRQPVVAHGNDLAVKESRVMYMAGMAVDTPVNSGLVIDESILKSCHAACKRVYGDSFEALPAIDQMGYSVDLYNLLVRMNASSGKELIQMKRLELEGMVKLLDVFISLGWSRKFPPFSPDNFSF